MLLKIPLEEILEPGRYRARVLGLQQRQRAVHGGAAASDNDTFLLWTFGILDPGHEGVTVKATSSTNLGPLSKAHRWLKSVLDRSLRPGEEIAEHMLVGKDCVIRVEVEKDQQGNLRNKVVDVLPADALDL